MDWGLAKVLAAGGVADDKSSRSATGAERHSDAAGQSRNVYARDIRHGRFTDADGSVMGTPAYMPPEQVLGPSTSDQRADVFGLERYCASS